MLKNLFRRNGRSPTSSTPIEPIFPGENFYLGQFESEEGINFAMMNQAYDNYPNKEFYPWCVQIVLEMKDKNEKGHPTDNEAEVLNDIEDRIENFLKLKHTVHFIGRVTRRDFRDLFFYIDQPNFEQKEIDKFFDEINSIRCLNFILEKDKNWEFVSGLIK